MPTQTELEIFYNSAYKVSLSRHFRQMSKIGRHLLDELETKVEGRTLLELGCSYGGFLRLAQKRGWSCVGVEINGESAAIARQSGLEVYAGSIDLNCERLAGRKFDLVVMWHVIEHLLEWRAALRLAVELLNPGGCLAIRTPNADSLGARFLGDYWEWFHSPEHVCIFSGRALQQMMSESGLKIEQVSSWRGDAGTLLTQSLTAIVSSLRHKLRSRRPTSGLGLRTTSNGLSQLRYNLSTVVDVIGRPIDHLFGVDGHTMQGSELFLLARRPELDC